MDIKENFKLRLNAKADEMGYSASFISEELKIPRGTVWQWFKGIALPRSANMKKLADLLGCSVSWLKGGPTALADLKPLSLEQLKAIAALAPKEGKQKHEDIIKEFQNKDLAAELNQILLEIEKRDPATLEREVKSFLEFTLAGLKENDKKNPNHNGG